MSSIADDPYGGITFPSEHFKPTDDEVGASIIITLRSVSEIEITGQDGRPKVGICLEGEDDDDVQRDWVAWSATNKREVARVQPQLGDRVKIAHLGRDKGAANQVTAARLFHLEVIES